MCDVCFGEEETGVREEEDGEGIGEAGGVGGGEVDGDGLWLVDEVGFEEEMTEW